MFRGDKVLSCGYNICSRCITKWIKTNIVYMTNAEDAYSVKWPDYKCQHKL